MKIKGNIEFEVEVSAKEMCEVMGTMTPEESKELRNKAMTDEVFGRQITSTAINNMFSGGSSLMENFLKLANK
tara:strand:+ start:254 stop:472 length:219 start_codon:yes stop_codon:yes gene_type:complete